MSEGQNTVAMAPMAPRSGHHNANAQSQTYHILEALQQNYSRPDVGTDSFSMGTRVVIPYHNFRSDLNMRSSEENSNRVGELLMRDVRQGAVSRISCRSMKEDML